MRGESANLSVQILQLSLVGGLDVGQRIASLKHIRQAFERNLLPVTQDGGVNPILRRELADGFGFLQELQHNLGFEGGSVRLFHATILPNAGVLIVQILGSTIYLGQAIKAFVTLKPGASATPKEIIAFCKERMPRHQYPRQVEIVDGIPKSETG